MIATSASAVIGNPTAAAATTTPPSQPSTTPSRRKKVEDVIEVSGVRMTLEYRVIALGKAYGPSAHTEGKKEIQDAIDSALDTIHTVLDPYNPDSEITLLNNTLQSTPSFTPTPVSSTLLTALQTAASAYRTTLGAYDVTAGVLADAWDEAVESAHAAPVVLDTDTVADLQARIGFFRLQLDEESQTLAAPQGTRLDLVGLAKGMGVDLMAAALRDAGYASFSVEWGGDLVVSGLPPSPSLGSPGWAVSVLAPPSTAALFGAWSDGKSPQEIRDGLKSRTQLNIPPTQTAIVTSGDYTSLSRFGYTHFVDPESCSRLRISPPVPASVTIVTSASCALADALATGSVILAARMESSQDEPSWLAHADPTLLPNLAYGMCWRSATAAPASDDAWVSTLESEYGSSSPPGASAAAFPLARLRRLLRCLPHTIWNLRVPALEDRLTSLTSVLVTGWDGLYFSLEPNGPVAPLLEQGSRASLGRVFRNEGGVEDTLWDAGLDVEVVSSTVQGDHVLIHAAWVDSGAAASCLATVVDTAKSTGLASEVVYANRSVTGLVPLSTRLLRGGEGNSARYEPGWDSVDALSATPAVLMVTRDLDRSKLNYVWRSVRMVDVSLDPPLVLVSTGDSDESAVPDVSVGSQATLNLVSSRQRQLLDKVCPGAGLNPVRASAAFQRLNTENIKTGSRSYSAIRSSSVLLFATVVEELGPGVFLMQVDALRERSPWKPSQSPFFSLGSPFLPDLPSMDGSSTTSASSASSLPPAPAPSSTSSASSSNPYAAAFGSASSSDVAALMAAFG